MHSAGGLLARLNQSGKMWDKTTSSVGEDGLVAGFSNYRTNEHLWKIERVCVHHSSGDVASADERGQVYVYSTSQNSYCAVRLASTPVSSLEFIHCRKARLIVAYRHGTIAIVDTDSKTVVGHLQLARPAVITRICCHPARPIATLVAEDGIVSIWDLRTLLCTKTLEAQEPLVDIGYALGGTLLGLTYQTIGVVYYHAANGNPELKCSLPESERQPRWVSMCASNNRNRILMAGDNGHLYCFDGCQGVPSSTQYADRVLSEGDNRYVKGVCPLLSVAELPLQLGNAICMQIMESSLNDLQGGAGTMGLSSQSHNVIMLTSTGHIIILNISEQRKSSRSVRANGAIPTVWVWRVVTDISAPSVPEKDALQTFCPTLSTTAGSSSVGPAKNKGSGPLKRQPSILTGRDRVVTLVDACYRKGAGPEFRNHLLSLPGKNDENCLEQQTYFMSFVVSDTGSLLIYDWSSILSTDYTLRAQGEACGSLLRHRGCGQLGMNMSVGTVSPSCYKEVSRESPSGKVAKGKGILTKASSSLHTSRPVTASGAVDENVSVNKKVNTAPGETEKHCRTPNSTVAERSRDRNKDRQGASRSNASKKKHHMSDVVVSDKDDGEGMSPYRSSSLYDLSMSSAHIEGGSRMSRAKLSFFLEKNGKYPDEYRPMIWRFLLKLPENGMAFADLVNRGTHPAFESRSLNRKYPLESSRLFKKLQSLCSQLSHWSSIFSEAPYIPQLCFPFILVFDNDELAALESVMSILMWWGYAWHICHPNPPAQLCDSFDAILLHFDPNLHRHFRSLEISPGLIGWRLTYTLYSEFLPKETWLRLMDFIFTNFECMEIMLLVPVVIMRLCNPSLLCVHSAEHILRFFALQQDIKASSIISMVEHMIVKTPKNLFVACYRGVKSKAHDTFVSVSSEVLKNSSSVKNNKLKDTGLPGSGNRPSSASKSLRGGDLDAEIAAWRATPVESIRQSLSAEAGSPVFPLPRGKYPAYDGYPKSVVDWELRKRSVQVTLDEELECREDVLKELEKRITELESDHEVWMNNHKAATENEVRSRYELMEREKEHMRQLTVMEEMISRKRLEALTALETTSKEEMQALDSATEETKKMLDAGEEHIRNKMEAFLNMQKHREAGESVEGIINERLSSIYLDRARDERMKSLTETLQRAESDMETRISQMSSELQHLEDVAKAKRVDRLERSKYNAEQEVTSRLRNTMLDRLTKLSVSRESQLATLERQASLKALREEALEAEDAIMRTQLLYEKEEENLSMEAAAKLSMNALAASKRKLSEVMDEIKAHSTALLEEERVARLKEGKSRIRSREFNVTVLQTDSLQKQMEEALNAQVEAQNELSRLKLLSLSNENGLRSSAHSSAKKIRVQEKNKSDSSTEGIDDSDSQIGDAKYVDIDEGSHLEQGAAHFSGERAISYRDPKRRRFDAVNALLESSPSDSDILPSSRDNIFKGKSSQNAGSIHLTEAFQERPLPSRSVLSPKETPIENENIFEEVCDVEEKFTDSTLRTRRFRTSANEDWSDDVDVQFPAAGRLKEKIKQSCADAITKGSSVVSKKHISSSNVRPKTEQKGVQWQDNRNSSGSDGDQYVGSVSDVLETKWSGFSYSDSVPEPGSEEDAIKKLAEKNLEVLVRLRADDRDGGDTVERDIRDLLLTESEVGASAGHSDISGDVATGDDDDSALWNFEKYR